MKYITAMVALLLCLSADPWQALINPASLMSAPNVPTQAER